MEVAWRWLVGVPTLWLLLREGKRILDATPLDQTGIHQFTLLDQTTSTYAVMRCVELLTPPVIATATWLLPLLMVIYAIASGVGRMLIISAAADESFSARWQWSRLPTLILLQAMRVTALTATLLLWIQGVAWAGGWAIVQPMHAVDPDPNIVAFLAVVITLTVALLTLWAIVSWVFNAAPVLALAEGRSIFSALGGAFHMGWLRGKLIEINLGLAVVKLALIVLVMVISSTPLPFETVVSGDTLYDWWLFTLVLYCIASDLFHVVRSVAYVELWQKWRSSIS